MHDESLDDPGSDNTLLRVEISGRLIDEVDVGRKTKGKNDSHTLQLTTREGLHFLIDELVQLQRLDDVGLELREEESSLDLLEKKLTNGTFELWGDLLRLHADLHTGDFLITVWVQSTSEQLAESRLARTVLAHHDNDFRVSEITSLNAEMEATQGLFHLWIIKGTGSISHELISGFGNAECQRLLPETKIFGWDIAIKENVDTLPNRSWQSDNTIDGRFAVKDADKVRKIVQNRQIVLNTDDIVVGSKEGSDYFRSAQTLLDIKVGGRFIKHVPIQLYQYTCFSFAKGGVHISLLDANGTYGKSLKFTSRKKVHVSIHDVI